MYFSVKLSGKLSKLGIIFYSETSTVQKFSMRFDVSYYPVAIETPELNK